MIELLRLTAPEIIVALAGLLVLVVDIGLLRRTALALRVSITVAIATLGCIIAFANIHTLGVLPAGLLVVTPLTLLVQRALLVLSILVLALCTRSRFTDHAGEYRALILFATTAMMLLVSTQNLLVIFITIEFLSLCLYVLAAFDKDNPASAKAGLTYFLYGGMSAGILLFGMSLLYGFSGSLFLPSIATAVNAAPDDPLLKLAMVMVVAGLGFKIAAAPFHMWAPEVYQGAPAASTALIASSSKVASFFVLLLIFSTSLDHTVGAATLIVLLAALSMVWGNLAAIAQTSARRLLAYSAIGHAGYMLIAVAAHSYSTLLYYVFTYALATVGAFGVLVALENEKVDSTADFAGLAKRSPDVAFCLLIFFLSLAGIPPLAGFFGKFYLFSAGLHAGHLWLVLLAIAMSVVSFYYYLKVLKQVYVATSAEDAPPIQVSRNIRVTLWATAALVVLLGCLPDLLLRPLTAALR
jgi:NADH-quinone oxidoreductase subunit N